MQDKQIADDPDFLTQEYLNMIYTVTKPDLSDLWGYSQVQWCEAEWIERLRGLRPADHLAAWSLRPEVWQEFADRGFGYTYGERYRSTPDSSDGVLASIIDELRNHPDSRQLFMPVWRELDNQVLGQRRVPCSLGYWFALRGGRLNITYLQRSGDYFTHLANDMYLTHKLQIYVAQQVGAKPGNFTHWIGSLHVYRRDVADVF